MVTVAFVLTAAATSDVQAAPLALETMYATSYTVTDACVSVSNGALMTDGDLNTYGTVSFPTGCQYHNIRFYLPTGAIGPGTFHMKVDFHNPAFGYWAYHTYTCTGAHDEGYNFNTAGGIVDLDETIDAGICNLSNILEWDEAAKSMTVDIYESYAEFTSYQNTLTPTTTLTPTATLDSGVSSDAYGLLNGNFEEQTLAPWEAQNGRLISADAGQQPLTGPASCGSNYFEFDPYFYRSTLFEPQSGFSGAGTNTPTPELVLREVWRESPALVQRFYWPGGTLYFQAQVRAPTSLQYPEVGIEIVEVTAGYNVPAGLRSFWQPGGGLSSSLDWQTISVTSSYPLPPGYYDFKLSTGYEWRQYPVYVSDDPNRDTNQGYRFFFDDVTVSTGAYSSSCVGGATLTPTATRTLTPTATRTPTGTRTATVTNTPTAGPVSSWSNCAFESGSNGWSGTNFNVQLAGGPIGPSYAQVNNGGVMRQNFVWSGGTSYFTFWVGPGSYGSIRVRNLTTSLSQTLYVAANPPAWARQDRVLVNLGPGSYAFEVVPNASAGFKIDGVMIAKNAFQYCGSTISGTPVTPTSGPTSFVTATGTNTLAATRTASATITITPSRTAFATNTPAATYTLVATNTQPATATQLPPEQTATAQGTPIATFTALATYTPYPTYTQYATPPQQPPPGPDADCVAPQSGDIPGWMAYQQCQSFSFFSWSPTNSAQVSYWSTAAVGKEPFGTIDQTGQAIGDLQALLSSTDWSSTGASCDQPPDPITFLRQARGILLGDLQFTDTTYYFQQDCNMAAEAVVGSIITRGMCIAINILCLVGLMQWFQWFTNAVFFFAFLLYIKTNWIDKAVS